MLKDFAPVLKIFLRFVVLYFLMVFFYQMYLNQYDPKVADGVTRIVAEHTYQLLNFLGYETQITDAKKSAGIYFYVKKIWATIMIEGCNAVSVMIMFVAFVFAFYKGFKTFVFVFVGLVILYILNVLRIVGLNIIIVDYPEYKKIAHDYFFPAIIYGGIVLLWLIWIKFFVLKEPQKQPRES